MWQWKMDIRFCYAKLIEGKRFIIGRIVRLQLL